MNVLVQHKLCIHTISTSIHLKPESNARLPADWNNPEVSCNDRQAKVVLNNSVSVIVPCEYLHEGSTISEQLIT